MTVCVNIEKNYKGFSLHTAFETDGAIMGILGASGSGKSLTLKCIAGIETPDRGKIVINGRTVFDSEKKINLKPRQRRVGYLFQNYALFPTMTVEQNIACGYHGAKGQCAEVVAEYIKRYHLTGLEKHYPSQLSGGQQQRTALARMMVSSPEVLLLDEPFSALDGFLKDVVQREMQEFLEDFSGDMVLVTHSRDEAYRFCQRLTLLKDGKSILSGNTKDIFEQPGLLEACRLTGCKNYSRIERLDEYHVLALDWDLKLCTKDRVLPEHTHIAVRGHWISSVGALGENCFSVQVQQCMETTFEHQYLVKNAESEEAAPIWWMRPKSSFRENPRENMPEYLYLPPEHLMLLRG